MVRKLSGSKNCELQALVVLVTVLVMVVVAINYMNSH